MNKKDIIKKVWVKPVVSILIIAKDTFGGSGEGIETGKNFRRPGPPVNPTPI